ncbi:MAG: chemotaxis-specific protein-glutamate methyltransferase CheB [Oscillospiraceae bacterium]|nr:chemotaxis-specific protein-glutamate methyltransferase CheB [Oscillospiraceae bacterium]
MTNKIKTLIVDDSLVFRNMAARSLENNPNIEVVGTAVDAFDAGEKITDLNPDVLILDINMPRMSGKQFLTRLMAECPIACVMVTSSDADERELLNLGAAAFMKKPNSSEEMRIFGSTIAVKIIAAAQKRVSPLRRAVKIAPPAPSAPPPSAQGNRFGRVNPIMPSALELSGVGDKGRNGYMVALGASTGGTDALECVLRAFPKDMPPTLVVQHMPPVFTKMYAERLDKCCPMSIKEAEDGDRLTNGVCLIGAGGYHMELKKDARGYFVKCYTGEKVSGHIPSVDVMFESVANTAGNKAVGAILTGMGADGARGLLKMRNKGSFTVGQNQETCVVYGMPMEAHKLGACKEQHPLESIGAVLCKALSQGWK